MSGQEREALNDLAAIRKRLNEIKQHLGVLFLLRPGGHDGDQ